VEKEDKMPIMEIERLDRRSSDAQIQAAISACIATEIRNGRAPDQAKAMCYAMVKEKTGRELTPQGGGREVEPVEGV